MSRIKAKDVFYSAKGEYESKFNKVIGQYDDYINKLLRDVRIWQMIGVFALLMFTGTIAGWFYVLSIREQIPIVIEVNELGRARYVGDLNQRSYLRGYGIREYMVEAVIRDFLRYTRAIHLDEELMMQNFNQASMWLSDDMKRKLSMEISQDNPFAHVGRLRREVEIETSLKMTANTWQYDFFEVVKDIYGREQSRTRMRGLFTITLREPETNNERYFNPLGIYIIEYDIRRVNEVVR